MVPENTTPNRRPATKDEPLVPARGHVRRPGVVTLPKPLSQLGRGECRYCVEDAPEGAMETALFCAAPSPGSSYCPAHRRRCLIAPRLSAEQLAAEVEAHLTRRG